MTRPPWASSTTARRWLAVGAVVLLLVSFRVATHSFGTQTVLSDGARAAASCRSPWRSAGAASPQQRFTLWVMSGGTGQRREEGIAILGSRCRTRARARMAFAGSLFAVAALCCWLALPPRRPHRLRRETMRA